MLLPFLLHIFQLKRGSLRCCAIAKKICSKQRLRFFAFNSALNISGSSFISISLAMFFIFASFNIYASFVCASACFSLLALEGRLINYQRTDKRISYPQKTNERRSFVKFPIFLRESFLFLLLTWYKLRLCEWCL